MWRDIYYYYNVVCTPLFVLTPQFLWALHTCKLDLLRNLCWRCSIDTWAKLDLCLLTKNLSLSSACNFPISSVSTSLTHFCLGKIYFRDFKIFNEFCDHQPYTLLFSFSNFFPVPSLPLFYSVLAYFISIQLRYLKLRQFSVTNFTSNVKCVNVTTKCGYRPRIELIKNVKLLVASI